MITESAFRPAWWLPGAHAQTLFPALFRPRRAPRLQRERLQSPDGDFLDLDWTARDSRQRVLLLHGLEGSLESHYAGNLLCALDAQGYSAGLLYFRGCSGEPNLLARSYHSGVSDDLDLAVRHVLARYSRCRLAIIGYSLGGNVLLKWLGEQRASAPASLAIAVSVPFDLDAAASHLNGGLSRLYRHYLLGKLRRSVRRKLDAHALPVSNDALDRLDTFHAFDDAVTAPLHGFRDVQDYYGRCSSRQFLPSISVPTLILQSRDDPFLPPRALPGADELPAAVTLELAAHGGHAGFISGNNPFRPVYWLEQRILQALAAQFRQ